MALRYSLHKTCQSIFKLFCVPWSPLKKTGFCVLRALETDAAAKVPSSKKKGKRESCFITDEALAADLISGISVDLKDPRSTLIELSPGYGILTKVLLNAGVKKLVAFEPDINYHQHLEALQADLNDGRLKYFGQDFMKLPRLHAFDTLSSGSESEYFPEEKDNVSIYRCIKTQTSWEEEPLVRVLGVTACNRQKELLFLRKLLFGLATQESLYAVGRPEFFLFVGPDEYDVMTMPFPPSNLTKYRPPAVFYKLFFDITLIDKVPKTCFTPKLPVRIKKRADAENDPSFLYFVHLRPKQYLYRDVCSLEYFPAFLFFVQQLMYKRKWRLIPRFESGPMLIKKECFREELVGNSGLWAPGYGLELIKMGFSMMQLTGEVPPEDWVRLFQAFLESPYYSDSSFKTAFEAQSQGLFSESVTED